jgi:putative salt-induced outer membrane protein
MKHLSGIALAALLSNTAFAETSTDAAPAAWSGDIEFGYNQTEGNTNESSVLGKAAAKRKSGLWTYDATVSGQNTEAEGVRSAEKYFTSHRLAYDVDKNDYTFGYLSGNKDRFSGYVYQGTLSFGYGRRLLKTDTMTWDAEIGPGLRVSEFETPSDEGDGKIEEAIVRVSTDFKVKLSETAEFSQSLSVDAGSDNTVSKSVTALKTKIVGGFGLKLSYTIDYNETVPNDTQHMDRQTSVTVVYSF